MNKKEKQYAMVVGLLAILFLGVAQMGYLSQYGIAPFFAQTGTTPPPNNGGGDTQDDYITGIGKYQLDFKAADSAAPGTALTIATNIDLFCYHYVGGQWNPEGAAYNPASTQYFTATAADGGYMWISYEVKSGQNYYVDYQKILSSESGFVKGYRYVDVDADTKKEFVFQYSLIGQQIPNQGYPVVSFLAWALEYDTAFPGFNTPTGLTSIGTSLNTSYVNYQFTMSAALKALAIYKIELKCNTTVETELVLDNVQIPGLGTIDGNAFSKTISDSQMFWSYPISTGFDGALYPRLATGAQNEFDMHVKVDVLSSHDITMNLTIYYLIAQTEAGSSATKQVQFDIA